MNADVFYTAAIRFASWEIERRALLEDNLEDSLGIRIAESNVVSAVEDMLAAYKERT